jgi:hypothetical protein
MPEQLVELFPVEATWKKLDPILLESREQSGDPETWKWFEYLYDETKNSKKCPSLGS